MNTQDVIDRLRFNFEQFAEGNQQPFIDFLAEDVVIKLPLPTNVPWHGTHTGKDKMAWYLEQVADAMEFEAFELIDVFGSGESFAVHMHERVRLKSTGKYVEHDEIFLYRIKDGLITEYQEFADTNQMREAFTLD